MNRPSFLAMLSAGALGLAAMGCGTTKPPPADQAPVVAPPPSVAQPVNEPVPVAPVAPAGKESAKPAPGKSTAMPSKPATTPASISPVAKEPAPTPAAAAPSAKAPTAPAPVPESAKSPVAPAASAHPYVGPEKCMMCHRLQYNSWNASQHKAKGLDCEGCHGNGGDYKAIPVMKDLAAAKKAGLILPDAVFCKKCHVKADASFLPMAHAHKAK